MLLRRSCSKSEEITACLVFGPAHTTLKAMARITDRRQAGEESFAQAKSEVGLAQYEVRSRAGWQRHMTLRLVAHGLLAAGIPARSFYETIPRREITKQMV